MDLEENSFIVTTRDTSYCPDVVMVGYDRNKEQDKDNSFRITCKASAPVLSQDPGIPVTPLKPLESLSAQKSISSSARETLISSAWFRLLVITYLLVVRMAGE